MTLKYSTGARNAVMGFMPFKQAFHGGRIEIYSGSQPATADAAVTGTLLCTITNNSGAFTAETRAVGTVTLAGSSGSVDALTVNGVEIMGSVTAFNSTLAQTAADVAAKINAYQSPVEYIATSSGAVITLTALPGKGASVNTFAVVSTTTTLTKTDVNMAGGVAGANGLTFGASGGTAGMVSKLASQVWTGSNAASGTAGYYRMYGSAADAGASDATGLLVREDGAISTTGAELNLSSTALASGVTTTISSWDRTLPTL